MTALRASAWLGAAGLLLASALSSGAWAQAGPPVRLTPPRLIDEAPAPQPPAAAEPAAPPAEAPVAPLIEVGRPAPIAVDSVGLFDASQARLPHGPVWDSS